MPVLIDQRFRANPAYELFPREQLAGDDGDQALTSPFSEPLYGYLQPKPRSELPRRPASPDMALLFLALQREGAVPEYFRSVLGRNAESHLMRLVLDGVLEVEHQSAFVSGPNAGEILLGNLAYSGKGRIASLSIDALRYAEALGDLSIPDMTRRLYDFGRRPVTSAQKRSIHHAESDGFRDFLRVAWPALNTYWVRSNPTDAYWMVWRPIRGNDNGERARFKLYVSPGLDETAEALQASAEILGQSPGIRGLKLGRGISGLTRADKLVAYFSRIDDLQEAGCRLHRRLEGCLVHGVPFTAELSPDGLLSWGADPPRKAPGQPGSWRLWLADKLATYLTAARRTKVSAPIWRFALGRLRLDGVNPDTWAPDVEFWSPPAVAT